MSEKERHGDHWSCLEENLDALEDSWLRKALEQGHVVDQRPNGPLSEGDVVGIAWPDLPLRVLTLIVGERNEAGDLCNVMASAYPWAFEGVSHHLVIDDIQPWESGIGAWVTAGFPDGDGPSLTFFDTRYYANKSHYQVGQEANFVLAAVAYRAEVVHPEPVLIEKLETIRAMRAGTPNEGDDSPIEIQLAGAAMLLPRDDALPGDHEFQGPVKEVEQFELNGRRVMRLALTMVRLLERDDADIDVYLYVDERRWSNDERPTPGTDIRGVFWLQGYFSGS